MTSFVKFLIVLLSIRKTNAVFTQCSMEAVEKCSGDMRLCSTSTDSDEREECGPCQERYVEMRDMQLSPSCVKIDENLWHNFQSVYEPFYKDDDNTDRKGLDAQLLNTSAQFISKHNLLNENLSYTLGLTPYSADSEAEYQQRSGYFYVNVTGTGDEIPTYDPPTVATADIPKNIDWVAAGAITPVKEQGRCGCSWTLGVCGAIEGAAFVYNGFNESMSFQQLISCNKRNLGCEGGSMTVGAIYASDNWFGGLTIEKDYPYLDFNGLTTDYCNLTTTTPPLSVKVSDPVEIGGLGTLLSFNERLEMFKLALVEKPIAIVMKSSCLTFSNYLSGILTDDGDCACSDSTCFDHSVLMVGYDDTGNIPYFKLKNSWGIGWGEDGYFCVAQIQKGSYGLFGILGEGIMFDAKQHITATSVPAVVDDSSFPVWAIIIIVIVCSLCCSLSIIGICLLRKRVEKEAAE